MMSAIGEVRHPRTFLLASFAVVLLGAGGAVGQSTFDPYNPSTGQYQEFVTPVFPSNLALPGQARQAIAADRQALYGTKVSAGTSFERFLRDGYEDRFNASSASLNDLNRYRGPGVPYYATGRADRANAPNREADREFNAIRQERERRYFEAIREKDAVKRARLLRRVNEPIDPKELALDDGPKGAAEDGSDLPKSNAAPGFRIGRSRETTPSQVGRENTATQPARPAFRMPLSGEPLITPSTSSTATMPRASEAAMPDRAPARPTAEMRAPVPPGRRRILSGPERRPRLPSEMVDRNRGTSSGPAGGAGTAPSATTTPDPR